MQQPPVNLPSLDQPGIVHASFGRLRIHLPDPAGHIATRLRGFPGVTYAEASSWTENILILFNPEQTSSETLMVALQALCLDSPAACEEAPSLLVPAAGAEPTGYVTGLRRSLYQVLGWASVGMAIVGFIIPGIPGAPFVILAGYFFIRSSPEAHAWLLSSRWFGPILRDWEQQRGIRRSLKYTAVGLILFAMAFILLIGLPSALVAVILIFEIIGLTIVLRLKVVEPTPPLLTLEPGPSPA